MSSKSSRLGAAADRLLIEISRNGDVLRNYYSRLHGISSEFGCGVELVRTVNYRFVAGPSRKRYCLYSTLLPLFEPTAVMLPCCLLLSSAAIRSYCHVICPCTAAVRPYYHRLTCWHRLCSSRWLPGDSEACRLCLFNTTRFMENNPGEDLPDYPVCPCCVLSAYKETTDDADGSICEFSLQAHSESP